MHQAGDIIYTEVLLPSKTKKPKYLLVLDWSDKVYCLVINTGVNPVYGNSLTRPHYIHLDLASHPFFNHDNSHIDCNQIIPFNEPDMAAAHAAEQDFLQGQISPAARELVIEAMRTTPMLYPAEKERFIPLLGGNYP